jgi:pectin methylesterase-like acyl-CoA thioesterase
MIQLLKPLMVLLILVGLGNGATITVGQSGYEYSSIQAAIDAANPGDMIEVQSCAYDERINVSKQLTIRGIDTGYGKPIIDAHHSGNSIIWLLYGSSLFYVGRLN